MPDRRTPPPIHDFESIHFLSPRQFHLPNGIVFSLFDNPNLDLIHMTVVVKAGALYEPKKRLASFCYGMLKECHPHMNSNDTDAFLDFYGTTIGISTGINKVSISLIFPKNNCEKIIPFLLQLLTNPVFKDENVNRFREKTLKNLEYNLRKTDYWATQLLFHEMFGDAFPFGKLVEPSDLEAITKKDLEDFLRDTCYAENISLFATGNLDEKIIHQINEGFGRIGGRQPATTNPKGVIPYHPRRIEEHWENAQQTAITLCQTLFPFNHPDAHRFNVTNTLFANYFGSRLMQNLREKNGYTYGISSTVMHYEGSGIHCIESSVNNEKVEDAIREIFKEMEILRNEPVGSDELETVRNYLIGNMFREIDGTVSYMESYMGKRFFGCDEQFFSDYLDAILSFTAEDIKAMANKYLQKESFGIILVGA